MIRHGEIERVGHRRRLPRLRGNATVLIAEGTSLRTVSHRRLPTRLLLRLRAHELDRRLAAGAGPDSSALLSLRAQELQSLVHRRLLGAGLRRRLAVSNLSPHPFDRQVPLARAEIRRSGALVDELAAILEATDPADTRGIARASLLLREGNSPLYVKHGSVSLDVALREAIDAMSTSPTISPPV
jgi:hypothetical protein